MEEKGMHGFMKNGYYSGKLLCSEDFIIEQNYIQKKFNAINGLFFGSGIVTGLTMRQMSDKRICIDKGSFLDEKGRLILVEEPIYINEQQLVSLKETNSDYDLVVLKYKEEDIDKVFELFSEEEDQKEYRYRRECFKVAVETMGQRKEPFWVREQFFSDVIVYEDFDLRIMQSIPLYIPFDREFQMQLSLISKNKITCSMEYHLKTERTLS